MFSTKPRIPITLCLSFERATVSSKPVTVAAPPISHFISSIDFGGFNDSPPESKHTPLPINVMGLLFLLPPSHSIITTLLSFLDPLPTASKASIPIFFNCCSFSIVTFIPIFFNLLHSSAKEDG